MRYATCRDVYCERWGEIPLAFDERVNCLRCPNCKELMFPVSGNPQKDAGYRESHKIIPILNKISTER